MGDRNDRVKEILIDNKKTGKFGRRIPFLGKLSKKAKIRTGVIALILVFVLFKIFSGGKNKENQVLDYSVKPAKKMDIASVLLETGTLAPLNQYKVTSLVPGKVITADFEESDYVKAGQCLYTMDADEAQSAISKTEKSLTRAKRGRENSERDYVTALEKLGKAQGRYEDAKKKYSKANKKYNNADKMYQTSKIVADKEGSIKTLQVKNGDTVQKGAKIADIYSDSVMKLVVPFNANEIDKKWIGKKAEVELIGSFETLTGKVTAITDTTTVLSGNQMVKKVTIVVNNPGGITNTTTANASVDKVSCESAGTFAYGRETTLNATVSGDITSILVSEGKSVKKGDTILLLDKSKSEDYFASYDTEYSTAKAAMEQAEELLDTAEDAVAKAREGIKGSMDTIEDARSELDDKKDILDDYYITAPIAGKVVKKKALAGDKISANDLSTEMAVIYDLNALTFQMSIDELDIMSVKEGQKVSVTAEALEGEEFTGTITNVSLISDSTGGVTQYPVTVRIDKAGKLIPGMNVKGKIVTAQKEKVIAVPVDAVMSENQVYIQDATVTEAKGDVPAGFRAKKVKLGISDGHNIEVISGVTEKDKVYVKRNLASAMDGSGWMYEE